MHDHDFTREQVAGAIVLSRSAMRSEPGSSSAHPAASGRWSTLVAGGPSELSCSVECGHPETVRREPMDAPREREADRAWRHGTPVRAASRGSLPTAQDHENRRRVARRRAAAERWRRTRGRWPADAWPTRDGRRLDADRQRPRVRAGRARQQRLTVGRGRRTDHVLDRPPGGQDRGTDRAPGASMPAPATRGRAQRSRGGRRRTEHPGARRRGDRAVQPNPDPAGRSTATTPRACAPTCCERASSRPTAPGA